jgi:hypothetical protein
MISTDINAADATWRCCRLEGEARNGARGYSSSAACIVSRLFGAFAYDNVPRVAIRTIVAKIK